MSKILLISLVVSALSCLVQCGCVSSQQDSVAVSTCQTLALRLILTH